MFKNQKATSVKFSPKKTFSLLLQIRLQSFSKSINSRKTTRSKNLELGHPNDLTKRDEALDVRGVSVPAAKRSSIVAKQW